MAELADALASRASFFGSVGAIPTMPTIIFFKISFHKRIMTKRDRIKIMNNIGYCHEISKNFATVLLCQWNDSKDGYKLGMALITAILDSGETMILSGSKIVNVGNNIEMREHSEINFCNGKIFLTFKGMKSNLIHSFIIK